MLLTASITNGSECPGFITQKSKDSFLQACQCWGPLLSSLQRAGGGREPGAPLVWEASVSGIIVEFGMLIDGLRELGPRAALNFPLGLNTAQG